MMINRTAIVVVCVICAVSSHFFAGMATQTKEIPADLMKELNTALKSETPRYEQINEPFLYYRVSAGKVFYLVFSQQAGTSAAGYGGPVHLALLLNESGGLQEFFVVAHQETPAFFSMLKKSSFWQQLREYSPGDDIAAVTGATLTSSALKQGVAKTIARFRDRVLNGK